MPFQGLPVPVHDALQSPNWESARATPMPSGNGCTQFNSPEKLTPSPPSPPGDALNYPSTDLTTTAWLESLTSLAFESYSESLQPCGSLTELEEKKQEEPRFDRPSKKRRTRTLSSPSANCSEFLQPTAVPHCIEEWLSPPRSFDTPSSTAVVDLRLLPPLPSALSGGGALASALQPTQTSPSLYTTEVADPIVLGSRHLSKTTYASSQLHSTGHLHSVEGSPVQAASSRPLWKNTSSSGSLSEPSSAHQTDQNNAKALKTDPQPLQVSADNEKDEAHHSDDTLAAAILGNPSSWMDTGLASSEELLSCFAGVSSRVVNLLTSQPSTALKERDRTSGSSSATETAGNLVSEGTTALTTDPMLATAAAAAAAAAALLGFSDQKVPNTFLPGNLETRHDDLLQNAMFFPTSPKLLPPLKKGSITSPFETYRPTASSIATTVSAQTLSSRLLGFQTDGEPLSLTGSKTETCETLPVSLAPAEFLGSTSTTTSLPARNNNNNSQTTTAAVPTTTALLNEGVVSPVLPSSLSSLTSSVAVAGSQLPTKDTSSLPSPAKNTATGPEASLKGATPPLLETGSAHSPSTYQALPAPSSSSPGGSTPVQSPSDPFDEGYQGEDGQWYRRPDVDEQCLQELCDLSEFEARDDSVKVLVPYSENISFPLGEGGRELLRACLNTKGCKGRQLQGASVPMLLQLAHEWGLWNVALRIKIERQTGQLCAKHEAFVRFKAVQSHLRKYLKREQMHTERDGRGQITDIRFEEMKHLTLGKEGREKLRTQLRRLHDREPYRMDDLLERYGFRYSELRNATVPQLLKMAYICCMWDEVIEACKKQEAKKETKSKKDCRGSSTPPAGTFVSNTEEQQQRRTQSVVATPYDSPQQLQQSPPAQSFPHPIEPVCIPELKGMRTPNNAESPSSTEPTQENLKPNTGITSY